jgi:hypothetical protein
MTLTRRPLLALTGLVLLTGTRIARAADIVRGSGTAATERRDVGAFVGVALGAPFKVVLRSAGREAIEIVADDNVLRLIETTLRGNGNDRTLQIELARNARIEPRTPIVVTVDVVRLERLALGGSGSIEGRSFKAPKLDAAVGGSGSIALRELDAGELSVAIGGSGGFRADGRARKLSINIAGSGNCDAEHLGAGEVSVAVAGSGDARVRADIALSASIAGSGDVYHSGAATPQVAIVGTGRVKRI